MAVHVRVETLLGELLLTGAVHLAAAAPFEAGSQEHEVQWVKGRAAAAGAMERLPRVAAAGDASAHPSVVLVMNVSRGVTVFSLGFC